jgi:polar amino acid transport system permease protein
VVVASGLSQWLPVLLRGTKYTILITFVSMGLALVLGLLLALPRLTPRRNIFGVLAQIFVDVIRSTPLLVQLFYIYFIFPTIGLTLSALTAGILGLGINYAAYISEVYRSGIQAVDRGQVEAADALGLNYRTTMKGIVLPQAIRVVLPSLGNYFALFKDTALVSTISVAELLFSGQLLAQSTFQYTGIYTTVFVIYFVISYPATLGVKWLERRMSVDGRHKGRSIRRGLQPKAVTERG